MKRKIPAVIAIAQTIVFLIGLAADTLAVAMFFGLIKSPSDLIIITSSAQTNQTVITFLAGFLLFYGLLPFSVLFLRLTQGKQAYLWYHASKRPGSFLVWVLLFHLVAAPLYILYAPMLKVVLPPEYQTNWALLGIFVCASLTLWIIGGSLRWYFAGLAREHNETPGWWLY
jgi:hypothetical protein